jgi:Tellurite resistance protein TerB
VVLPDSDGFDPTFCSRPLNKAPGTAERTGGIQKPGSTSPAVFPAQAGTSNPLILKCLYLRLHGNDGLNQNLLYLFTGGCMYLALAMMSAIAGLIWVLVVLQRAGNRPESFNPWVWLHRSRWRRVYGSHPLCGLENPTEVAAILLTEVARCEGRISPELNRTLQQIFRHEFRLNNDAAARLVQASARLLGDQDNLAEHLPPILDASSQSFSRGQASSLLSLMTRVATLESVLNEEQRRLIVATERYYEQLFNRRSGWKAGATTQKR